MRSVYWTERARGDLAAIRDFIARDSPHHADVVVARILSAVEQAAQLPESGRMLPVLNNPRVRELVRPPYRIVYRLIGADTIHVLTIHHTARLLTPPP